MREILFRKDQAEDKGAVMEVKDYPPYLDYPKPRRPQTNGDRIRAMTDEELANILTNYSNNGGWITETGRQICYERIIYWLQQPAESGDSDA